LYPNHPRPAENALATPATTGGRRPPKRQRVSSSTPNRDQGRQRENCFGTDDSDASYFAFNKIPNNIEIDDPVLSENDCVLISFHQIFCQFFFYFSF
jgi:hypothetical protein